MKIKLPFIRQPQHEELLTAIDLMMRKKGIGWLVKEAWDQVVGVEVVLEEVFLEVIARALQDCGVTRTPDDL